MTEATKERPVLLRSKDVEHMLRVSPRTLKRYVQAGKFPAPVKLTSRTSFWVEHLVIEWMNEQGIAVRTAQKPAVFGRNRQAAAFEKAAAA